MFISFGKKRVFWGFDISFVSIIICVFLIGAIYFIATEIQKNYVSSALHNIYMDLNKAVDYSEVDNGTSNTWKLPESTQFDDLEPFVNTYYSPYFKKSSFVKKEIFEEQYKYSILLDSDGQSTSPLITNYFVTNNGMIISFYYNKKHNYILLFVDINGQMIPNKMGWDIFVLIGYNGYNFEVLPFQNFNNMDSSQYHMTDRNYGCSKNLEIPFRNFYCAKVIELNDWKIPRGYPW